MTIRVKRRDERTAFFTSLKLLINIMLRVDESKQLSKFKVVSSFKRIFCEDDDGMKAETDVAETRKRKTEIFQLRFANICVVDQSFGRSA